MGEEHHADKDLTEAIDRFRGPLIGLIVSWGAPHTDAVEIAGDSFADAYLNRDKCRGDLNDIAVCGRWLRGVARNKYRNWRRGTSRRQRRVKIVAPEDLAQVPQKVAGEEDGRLTKLREAIEHLPSKQRQAVIMHYLEETSVGEVAALLSVTEKAVEGRLYQARRSLKENMQDASASLLGKALLL
jgi:RNA polymerase sigma factor (sigma-70 family)